jgi:hypothetical protein
MVSLIKSRPRPVLKNQFIGTDLLVIRKIIPELVTTLAPQQGVNISVADIEVVILKEKIVPS